MLSKTQQLATVKRNLGALDKLSSKAVRAASAISFRLKTRAIAQARHGELPSIKLDMMRELYPLLTELMLVTHLTGIKQTHAEDKKLALSVFDKTINALKNSLKANLSTLQIQYQTRALKISNDVSDAVEQDLRETVLGLIEEGVHVKQAATALAKRFSAHGLTSTKNYQLETIFKTQSALAYGAGRWQADQDPDIQEILWGYEYSAVGDDRTRPAHLALDGTRLPKDDPFWLRYWPPNGWNCRCVAIPIFQEEKAVPPPLETDDGDPIEPDEGFNFNAGRVLVDPVALSTASRHVVGWSFAYNPDQPRGSDGKWGGGGGSSSKSKGKSKGGKSKGGHGEGGSHADRVALYQKQFPGLTKSQLTKLAAINHRSPPGELHIPIALKKNAAFLKAVDQHYLVLKLNQ